MTSNSGKYTPQQYKKYNEQSVFKALGAIGSEASADELANFISQEIGEREENILPEVKQVLRRGIANGFLVRNGRYYSIIGDELEMQVDSTKRSRSRPSNRSKKVPVRIAFTSRKVEEEQEEESEEEESGDDGDQNEDGNEEGNEVEVSEEEVSEEMQTDSTANYRPKVKFYEMYHASESEGKESDEEYDTEPPTKRILLQSNF